MKRTKLVDRTTNTAWLPDREHDPAPRPPWALVHGTKASPTHLAFHHLKLFVLKESLVGPGNEAKLFYERGMLRTTHGEFQ